MHGAGRDLAVGLDGVPVSDPAAAARLLIRRRRTRQAAAPQLRPDQQPPPGDWRIWLLHPGRGWGKGFAAAHWIRDQVAAGARQIALVGSTQQEVRRVMVEKERSGILAVCPEAVYWPSKAEVRWPNGAIAYMYSAEKPDALRGPDHEVAWSDEIDSWGLETTNARADAAWKNLDLSLRVGQARMLVTSTPKPGRMVSQLLERAKGGEDVVVTTGSTYDNSANLAPRFIEALERQYKGTRLERQELYGEVLDEIHGGLWPASVFRYRATIADELARVVVGVDPSGGGDEIGIVAVGLLSPDEAVVLDDWSLHGSPALWAQRAVELLEKWSGDLIVAERNFGGDMVMATIRGASLAAPVKMVTSSRGKHLRAEPMSLAYEQGRVWHRRGEDVRLDLLEDEMRHMTVRGYEAEGSPNRLDAAVFAWTELLGTGPLIASYS